MGDTKRQFNNLYNKFSSRFRKHFDSLSNLMKPGFTDKEFIDEFKILYPYLWAEIETEYAFWKSKNDIIIKYGKKSRFNFPNPENFILTKSFHLRQKMRNQQLSQEYLSDEERKRLKDALIQESQIKLQKKQQKESEKLRLTQEVEPGFLSLIIDKYFKLTEKSQEVINTKLEIIREVGNYKSQQSKIFLQKVNAKEQNFELKQVAMKHLQDMGERVILRRKKQGKKKQYMEVGYEITDSPDNLIEKLYDTMQHFEATKEFDVFISHSSLDKENIIEFYKKINQLGLHIYIDWVNDKYLLKRDLINENTAKAILHRLSKSKLLISYITEASINSQWTPWEIGYFNGLGKPILIYNPENIAMPVYLNIYPKILQNENVFFVQDTNTGNLVKLKEWIIKIAVL